MYSPSGPSDDGLREVDLELDDHLGVRRHRNVVRAALDELDGLAAHAADDLPVVGVLRNLDRARIGDHRVDADDERCAKRLVPHALCLGLILREPVAWGGHQRHRLVVDDLAAVVADVRDAGLGVVADHESRSDVRAAVVGAVARDGQDRQVDVVAEDDVFVHRTVVDVRRRNAGAQSFDDLVEDVLLGTAIGDQRLGVRVVDAADERELGAVVLEHDRRARDRRALAHRLGHLEFERDGTIDVDQLALGTQGVEELSEILERHFAMPHTLLRGGC